MKNIVDIRPVIANIINIYNDSIDSNTLANIITDITNIADEKNSIETHKLISYFRNKAICENSQIKHIFANTIAYIEYISEISVDRIFASLSIDDTPSDICNKKDLGVCGMYCDGKNKSCSLYETEEPGYIGTCSRFEEDYEPCIEVCSFEEGDVV